MSKWPETNESLILRVKDPADAAAWTAFLAIYRPVVYRLALSRGVQHADADDLTQQVFLSIARSVERWTPDEDGPPFRAWLYRVAHNEILKSISRRRLDVGAGSSSVQELLGEVASPEADVTEELIHETRMQAFRWAAEEIRCEFNEGTWQMFWESTIDDRSVAEVALAHDRTNGAVYLARYRVMKRLKSKLDEVSDIWSKF